MRQARGLGDLLGAARIAVASFFMLALALSAEQVAALPAPGPLRFIAPTPTEGGISSSGTLSVRLDAACSFDPGTLAVTLDGVPIPAGDFLPFSNCINNRIVSQIAMVAVTLPNGTINSGPSQVNAGQGATFTGSGNGDGLSWNFDGGAAPATGSPTSPTFSPAGDFTVRLIATNDEALDASGLDGGNLVTDQRAFLAGDASPDTHQLTVVMPADVDFVNFESGPVHPLALSDDGTRLYVVNTPEGLLAAFDVAPDGSLSHAGDVAVGVDPVSLAVRPGTHEVWVANHISDSVSIVDGSALKLTATIAAGDEPTDVVFASGRAFVTLSGNEDRVKVYNASTQAEITSIEIFGDEPRALAVNDAGTEVYAIVLESGNQSTALFHELVEDGGGPPAPDPPRAGGLGSAPDVGLIVQLNPATGDWEDEDGNDWSSYIDFTLPDQDVFVIDADAALPTVIDTVSGVGTILFEVAPRPGSNELYVLNTDARNLVRFETNLRGHLVETRASVVNTSSGNVSIVDLNSHINYSVSPGPGSEIADSLAHPGDSEFSSDGSTLYVTAFGSSKVGVLNVASGQVTARIDVGGGPCGVELNESANRLYVLNSFENTISMVNTSNNTEIGVVGVAGPSQFNPSPDVIKIGRKFLYDGELTSGHGDTACATCHIFGNFDKLAWDLGEPEGEFVDYDDAPWVNFGPLLGPSTQGFDPMKGPMTTQTLRGLKGLEPFHWRGDRADFQAFNPAFVNLMGTAAQLSSADMDAYTDFIETVNFPPNPFLNLNGTFPATIQVPAQNGSGLVNGNPGTGQSLYINNNLDAGVFTCNQCHLLPTGTNNNLFNGNAEGESQDFKIPHMRNMYEKLGFDVIRPGLQNGNGNNIGASVLKAGFGFLHDGSLSLTEFLAAGVFTSNTQQERDMFAFMMAFPTETHPCVGAQVTVDNTNKAGGGVAFTIATLIARAEAGDCDVIAKGVVGGTAVGYAYNTGSDLFDSDSLLEAPQSEAALRAGIMAGDVLTFTGVPDGAGVRLGIDRDRDTWRDRTETFLGTDPANANSNPWEW